MTAADLIARLRERGAQLATDGSRLEVDAPEDVLTANLIDQLARSKFEIIALLVQPPLETADDLITLWERLGRPWVCNKWGTTIDDLPGWLEKTPISDWESARWALSIWAKQWPRRSSVENRSE